MQITVSLATAPATAVAGVFALHWIIPPYLSFFIVFGLSSW